MNKAIVTTPIYYVNDVPHIGHAYTTILCDMLKRALELKGEDVFFLTGTDEHGQKIEKAAQNAGLLPQEFTDKISVRFRQLWDDLGLDYDYFIRTTDASHISCVQYAFSQMLEKGDIYKGTYSGLYCVSCESYVTSKDATNNEENKEKCPDCGKELILLEEESYFFALSKYAKPLLEYAKSGAIKPNFRANEVINFIENGLEDLCITRSSFSWGIEAPIKDSSTTKKHIIYVWLDALMNYISSLGYGSNANKMEYFNNAIHIVGKDILRFHAIYWPAFLMSLGVALPRHIYAHGWWLIEGVKMSKSIGNVVNPKEMVELYGNDAFRYFLLREVSFGLDGDFARNALINRVNAELCNNLGNLLSRFIGMCEKYYKKSEITFETPANADFVRLNEMVKSVIAFENMTPNKSIEDVLEIINFANAKITQNTPWELYKNGDLKALNDTLALVANALLKAAILLYPVLPFSSVKILQSLGLLCVNDNVKTKLTDLYKSYICNLENRGDFILTNIGQLFPKIEKIEEQSEEALIASKPKKEAQKVVPQNDNLVELIDIKDFSKVVLKVGTIINASKVEKSEKLLKLEINLGEGELRQVISGIAEFYTTDELLNKQVCVVCNLKPAKLMGQLSYGMILACRDDTGLTLITPMRSTQNGTAIK